MGDIERKWWVQVRANGLPMRVASGSEDAAPLGGEWIEVVPAEQLAGAVEALERIEREAKARVGNESGRDVIAAAWLVEVTSDAIAALGGGRASL